MDSDASSTGPGLSLRWVEVTDARARTRLEMRWTTAASGQAQPSAPVAPAAPSTPPTAPHAA